MRISDWSSDVCSSDLVTGSGKTFTVAHVIQEVKRPTLILAPNKTLAAQLYGEMKSFFPHNAVEYFVSYRSEERRVGQECVSTCRSRGTPYPKKKNENMKMKIIMIYRSYRRHRI